MKLIKLFYLTLALVVFVGFGCKKKPTSTRPTLHQVVKEGYAEQAKSLISSGTDINAKDWHSWTPLYYAAKYGYRNIVELLIDNGADIKALDDYG